MRETHPLIWLDPVCDECRAAQSDGDVCWCGSPAQPACELCGRPPLRYRLDPEPWTPEPLEDEE